MPDPEQGAERLVPVPRSRPFISRHGPPPEPQPEQRIAAIVAPRPDPAPRRVPTEPAPRVPVRTPSERLTAPILRDDAMDEIAALSTPEPLDDDVRRSGWSTAVEKALSEPPTLTDAAPDAPVYRVRVTPETPQLTEIASLGDAAVVDEVISPEFSIIRDSLIAAVNDMPPLPREKPLRPKGIQVAGSSTGVTTHSGPPLTTQPANDPKALVSCLVNRTETIISAYGFNTERFIAMSQGPRSARDLAFLRALRNSGKQVQVKGRTFDLYLMKGDLNLATVLVEQVAASDAPAAVNQR